MNEEVRARLAEINKRVAKAKAVKKQESGQACPVDPAERELCEGCQ